MTFVDNLYLSDGETASPTAYSLAFCSSQCLLLRAYQYRPTPVCENHSYIVLNVATMVYYYCLVQEIASNIRGSLDLAIQP